MGCLTREQTAKIVRLRSKTKNISEIVRILADNECQTSRLSVRRFLRRFQERQSFENAPTPGLPAEQVILEVLNFIDAEMERNYELTAPCCIHSISIGLPVIRAHHCQRYCFVVKLVFLWPPLCCVLLTH